MSMLAKWEASFALAERHVSKIAVDILKFYQNFEKKPSHVDYLNLNKYAKSAYLRKEYRVRKYDTYIQPVVKQVNELNRFSYSYLPITQVCIKYLRESNWLVRKLFSESSKNQVAAKRHYKEYSTIFDGSFSSRLIGKLKLEIFIDDANFAPSNGIGTKGQKFLNVYLTCSDIPFEKRIHSNEMEMILVANRAKLNKLESSNSLRHLFGHFREELSHLMKNGLQIEVDNKSATIFVTLSTICGDNLGVYELTGNKRCFSLDAFVCRFCGAKGRRKNGDDSEVLDIQSLCQSYPLISEQGAHSLSELGIIHDFVFDGLPGITRWNCAPPDLTHDLAEGVVTNIIELLLTSIVKRNGFLGSTKYNITIIAKRIENRKFYEGTPIAKWCGSEGFKIVGKAIQVSKHFNIVHRL
jgi:hypothetical protein